MGSGFFPEPTQSSSPCHIMWQVPQPPMSTSGDRSPGLGLFWTRDIDKGIFTPQLLFSLDSHMHFCPFHVSVQSHMCALYSPWHLTSTWTRTQGDLTKRATKEHTKNVLMFSACGSHSHGSGLLPDALPSCTLALGPHCLGLPALCKGSTPPLPPSPKGT